MIIKKTEALKKVIWK